MNICHARRRPVACRLAIGLLAAWLLGSLVSLSAWAQDKQVEDKAAEISAAKTTDSESKQQPAKESAKKEPGKDQADKTPTDKVPATPAEPAKPAETLLKVDPKNPPNILLIVANDLGYGDLGVYNPACKIPTPRLNKLAAAGVQLSDAHAAASESTPSRYAILTGRYAWRTQLKKGSFIPWEGALIAKDRLTLPAMLKKAGYTTACIGQWHLGINWPLRPGQKRPTPQVEAPFITRDTLWALKTFDFSKPVAEGPTARGFDLFYGLDQPGFPPYCLLDNNMPLGLPSVPKTRDVPGIDGPMALDFKPDAVLPSVVDRAEKFIAEEAKKAKKPFFLYLPLPAPGGLTAPNEQFAGKSKVGTYGDAVMETDWAVGQVLDTLKAVGVADNTLVIFTSANGPDATKYTRDRQLQHDSTAKWLGCKKDNWEGGHRVPLIAVWPRHIAAGSKCDEVVCLSDLMATCAALVGQKLPPNTGEDSFNVLPALTGEKPKTPIREATVHQSGRGEFAVRQGNWVLLLHPGSGGNDYRGAAYYNHYYEGQFQLYDLKADPRQTKNVAADHLDVVGNMIDLVRRYINAGRSTPGPKQANDTPNDWKRLPVAQ